MMMAGNNKVEKCPVFCDMGFLQDTDTLKFSGTLNFIGTFVASMS